MKFSRMIAIIVVGGMGLAATPAALAGSTFLFNQNQTYQGMGNSPFQNIAGSSGFHLENFENGSVNSLITAIGGSIKGPSNSTDSVDADDGSIDGSGQGGHSYSTTGKSMTFKFATVDGAKPTMAGLAWTDGRKNAMVTFRAWNAAGELLGKVRVKLGDLARNGGTGEDRFFGITSDEGISRIRISSSKPGFEVDHVQFGYGFSVVPVPPAFALGAAGLAGLSLWRRLHRPSAV
jgi:hypothetical protein